MFSKLNFHAPIAMIIQSLAKGLPGFLAGKPLAENLRPIVRLFQLDIRRLQKTIQPGPVGVVYGKPPADHWDILTQPGRIQRLGGRFAVCTHQTAGPQQHAAKMVLVTSL